MLQNFQLSLPFLEDINSRLVAIEQRLDAINKPNPLEGIWLNTKEAAKALGISLRLLQEKRNRSEISFSQAGSIIRYRAEDIQQYLMDHFIKSVYQKGGAA